MVRQPSVDLQPVRVFLAGATQRIFSAAMFPPRPGQNKPPGYLYTVLDGGARA